MRWRLKSPVSRLFTQPFIQGAVKKNIKTPRHWPLCGEVTGDRWIPRTKASIKENVPISWRHHGAREVLKVWDPWLNISNCSENWQVTRHHFCWSACQISKQYKHFNTQSHVFETLGDITVRRFMWFESIPCKGVYEYYTALYSCKNGSIPM